MNSKIRAELEKRGAYTIAQVVPSDEDSNYGELLLWIAERVADTKLFKQVAVVDNGYRAFKYPHAIIIPQDVSMNIVTNRSNETTYPIHVTARVLDSNPFRAIRSLASINVRLMQLLLRKPTVEKLDLPQRGSILHDIKVLSAPILPSGRGADEYETTVRVECIVREPFHEEDRFDD